MLIWAAARFGTRVAVVQVLAVGTGATLATLRGGGPFASVVEPAVTVTALQTYLLCLGVAVVVLGLTVEDDRRKAVVLAAGESLYRRTFDEAMLGMLMLRIEGRTRADGGPDRAQQPGGHADARPGRLTGRSAGASTSCCTPTRPPSSGPP